MNMPLRVGIDLVSVEEVQTSIAAYGDRYLSRVYSERELLDSRGRPAHLAARFAAKEAAMKALRRGDEGLSWKSIEVRSRGGGQPALELTGEAAELAHRRGVRSISVSLAHKRDHAAAVVMMEANS
jgi:holo-[acyl-carrier protein] synthase